MTTSEFVERAIEVHGSLYDYTKTYFERTDKPVQIVCQRHGPFDQLASNHLRGYGCKQCGIERQRKTTKQFVTEAKQVHDSCYSYRQAKYVNDLTKVVVECVQHGPFKIRPSKHISGTGCPKCANKNVTTEEFITKCRAVHGNKYDYSKVKYQPGYAKVEIICPRHGSFFQVTYNHLSNKQGCPVCKLEKAKQNIGLYGDALFNSRPETRLLPVKFYLIECSSENERFFKVGITTNIQSRMYSIPYDVKLIIEEETSLEDAFEKEQKIKSQYVKYEPIQKFSGWTECFTF